ncbi:hypothetical protein BDD12DRAFT_909157 [Trichophaea hybrida]|nr:hypothetical protein BDD12DRAFT_909157 [Trichophaea hybrida]
MPPQWTEHERRRLLLAICESFIIQSSGARRMPNWAAVKDHLGPQYSSYTDSGLRRQYNQIRSRSSGTCEESPPKTPGSKRAYGEAFPKGSLGELEDDDVDRLIKHEDDECGQPRIKTETVENGVIILDDDDDDDLYTTSPIKKREFTPRPGYMKPQGPRPPSPPPPPPEMVTATAPQRGLYEFGPVPPRPQFKRPAPQGNKPPSPPLPPPARGLFEFGSPSPRPRVNRTAARGYRPPSPPPPPPPPTRTRFKRTTPRGYRPPSPPPPPESQFENKRGGLP